jgi:hypothetical protein
MSECSSRIYMSSIALSAEILCHIFTIRCSSQGTSWTGRNIQIYEQVIFSVKSTQISQWCRKQRTKWNICVNKNTRSDAQITTSSISPAVKRKSVTLNCQPSEYEHQLTIIHTQVVAVLTCADTANHPVSGPEIKGDRFSLHFWQKNRPRHFLHGFFNFSCHSFHKYPHSSNVTAKSPQ